MIDLATSDITGSLLWAVCGCY